MEKRASCKETVFVIMKSKEGVSGWGENEWVKRDRRVP